MDKLFTRINTGKSRAITDCDEFTRYSSFVTGNKDKCFKIISKTGE